MRGFARGLAALVLIAASSTAARAQATIPVPPSCPVSTCVAPLASSQLENLGRLKAEIKTYYTNGAYAAETATIEHDAAGYLRRRVAAHVTHPAIVLDIDDTALSTFGYEAEHDFGYDAASWNAAARRGFPAIPATLALTRAAHRAGVTVFFITGRRTPQKSLTAANLRADGYAFTALYMRPVTDHDKSVVPFKSGTRAAIERAGYHILETVGDQWSDLKGGHAERAYKLPNPMYYLP